MVPFQCGVEREKSINIERPTGTDSLFNIWDRSVELIQFPLEILNYGKLLVVGGYWDGRLIVMSSETGIVVDK